VNIFNTGTRLYFAAIASIISFGFFSLAYSLSLLVNYLIPNAFGTILPAMLPKKNISENNRVLIVIKTFKLCLFLMLLTVATTIPLMKFIIIIAFGEEYSKAFIIIVLWF
jgi:O-antigen/teichoic acid export membrane protein